MRLGAALGSIGKRCVSRRQCEYVQIGNSFYSLLKYTVNMLEPAALCSVYGARDSKKTDVGGNGNALNCT